MSYDHSVVNDDFGNDFWRPEFKSVPNVSTPRPRLKIAKWFTSRRLKILTLLCFSYRSTPPYLCLCYKYCRGEIKITYVFRNQFYFFKLQECEGRRN